jgi:galactokinase
MSTDSARRRRYRDRADGTLVRAWAPGRVNLMGDHTDYVGGLALPMAIDLATTVEGRRSSDRVRLGSADLDGTVDIDLAARRADAATVTPPWGRYVAGVIGEAAPRHGIDGGVSTTIPIGAGLSSSAALEVAVALALGTELTSIELAQACQRAEQRAAGVPCGLMDQLVSIEGTEGHALLIDFRSLAIERVPVPTSIAVVVIHSGQTRDLADSGYADRRRQVEAAEIGPLRDAAPSDLAAIADPVTRRRARHVVTENERVISFAEALRADEPARLGAIMAASHSSNRDDFEASTPIVDALVDRLVTTPGVFGARLVGGGFGGCVVAITEPDTLTEGWTVQASDGARVE